MANSSISLTNPFYATTLATVLTFAAKFDFSLNVFQGREMRRRALNHPTVVTAKSMPSPSPQVRLSGRLVV